MEEKPTIEICEGICEECPFYDGEFCLLIAHY